MLNHLNCLRVMRKHSCVKERMNTISDAIGAVQIKMEQLCKGPFEESELKYEQVNDMIKEMIGSPVLGAKIKGSHSDHLEIQKSLSKKNTT